MSGGNQPIASGHNNKPKSLSASSGRYHYDEASRLATPTVVDGAVVAVDYDGVDD